MTALPPCAICASQRGVTLDACLLPRVLYDVPGKVGLDFDLAEISSGMYGFLLVIIMLLRPEGLLPDRRHRSSRTAFPRN